MRRREFIRLSAVTGIAVTTGTLARGPIHRSGPASFQFGLAAYSLRNYFAYMKGKPRAPAEDGAAIDMVGFLDYCVAQKFDAAELTSYFFDPDADEDYFRNLKYEAFLRGITISGTAIGNNFTVGKGPKLDAEIESAIDWIDKAAILARLTFDSSPEPASNSPTIQPAWKKPPKRSTTVQSTPHRRGFFLASKTTAS